MSFLGIGPDAPTPTTASLDSATQGLVNQQAQTASDPASSFGAKLNTGISPTLGTESKEVGAQQDAQQGGAFTGAAIRNQYQNAQAKNIDQQLNANNYKGQLMKADYMNQTAQALLGQMQNQVQAQQTITNANIAQTMARAQLINGLFQTADTGIGMAYGNRRKNPGPTPASSGLGNPGVGNYVGGDTGYSDTELV